jgi:hypothetical protein
MQGQEVRVAADDATGAAVYGKLKELVVTDVAAYPNLLSDLNEVNFNCKGR